MMFKRSSFAEWPLYPITERKRYEETIRHMAYHDSLTVLPQALSRPDLRAPPQARSNQMLALIYLDLIISRLSTILWVICRDLLQEVAKRLKSLQDRGIRLPAWAAMSLCLLPGIKDAKDAGLLKNSEEFFLYFIIEGQRFTPPRASVFAFSPTTGRMSNPNQKRGQRTHRKERATVTDLHPGHEQGLYRTATPKDLRRALRMRNGPLLPALIDIKTKKKA